MNVKKSTKGAISVFLTIILVPCIVVTSIFVDVGRVSLSKSVTESAGDLALNSLLTNYDADLSEYYGLMASCQSIDEFYTITESYFERMLVSAGMSDSEIESIWSKLQSMGDNAQVSDLLRIEVQDTGSGGMISPVADANLANPTLIKDQIVDFMKYRAPIEIFRNTVLNTVAEASDTMEHAGNDKILAEKKQAFYTAEHELLEEMYQINKKLTAYREKFDKGEKKPADIITALKGYEATYKQVHTAIVKDLFNTEEIGQIKRKTYSLSSYSANTYNSKNQADSTDYCNALNHLGNCTAAMENAKTALVSTLEDYSMDGAYDIQLWAKIYKDTQFQSRLNTFNNCADNLLSAYTEAENAKNNLDKAAKDSTYNYGSSSYTASGLFDKYKTEFNSLYKSCLNAGASANDTYVNYMNKLQSISTSATNKDRISSSKHKLPNGKTVADTVNGIYKEMSGFSTYLSGCKDALKGIAKKVGNLTKLVKNYQTAFTAWKEMADSYTSEMSEADREEIKGTDISQYTKYVTEGSVGTLKARIENMNTFYDQLIKAVKKMTYNGKSIYNIKNYKEAKNAAGGKVSKDNIPLQTASLDSYVNSTFEFKTGEPIPTVTNSNNPDLTVNQPKLYEFMIKQFAGKDDSEKPDGDTKFGDLKKQEKDNKKKENDQNAENEPKNNITELSSAGDFPSNFNSKTFGLGSGLGSMAGLAGGLVKIFVGDTGELENMRDALYTTEYAKGMFSYYTYEKEGKYNLLEAEKQEKLTWSKADDAYKDVADKWLSTDLEDYYNKSLTNKMINSTNNYANGAELEYILYGNTNKKNINTALTSIFAIRYILNLPYAFLAFWKAENSVTAGTIEIVANAISSMTAGIVPAALVKTTIILLLTALETINDMQMLKAGMPVKFLKVYKSKTKEEDPAWVMQFSSLGGGNSEITEGKGEAKREFCLSYGDYLYVFLLIGYRDTGALGQGMYKRTGDVIQSNIRHLIGGDGSGYKLNKSIVYFNMEATLRVKPLMLALPIANGYGDEVKNSTDWCTYRYKATRGYS